MLEHTTIHHEPETKMREILQVPSKSLMIQLESNDAGCRALSEGIHRFLSHFYERCETDVWDGGNHLRAKLNTDLVH